MARRKQDLIELTARLPWWVSLLLGLGLYGFMAHILPLNLSSPLQRALIPTLTIAALAGMRLVDGEGLASMLRLESLEGEEAVERCPRCGSELVRRVARRGRDAGEPVMGCSGFPRCRYTLADRLASDAPDPFACSG